MKNKKEKIKLALIDSHALIHRAYHALPPMTTKEGQPTGAVYGFTTMLLKMLKTVKPTHVAATFDLKGPTFRHLAYQEYKAHRKKPDDELIAQFVVVREVLTAFNIPIIDKQGFEADDIIGTLAKQMAGKAKVVVVTGDKDALQLVNDDVTVFTLKRGMSDTVLYDEALVRERYGFEPLLLPDYKGLAGDPSDNIPGVRGVGDKTAKDLVSKYGSIEEIYAHLEEVVPRVKSRLEDQREAALFSRKLATIKRNVKIKFNIEDAKLDDFDVEQVRQVFEKLGFRSLLGRLPQSARGGVQPTLFRNQGVPEEDLAKSHKKPSLVPADGNVRGLERVLTDQLVVGSSRKVVRGQMKNFHLVESEREQQELIKRLNKEKCVAVDTENDRLGAREYPIVGLSFAVKNGQKIEAWYAPTDRKQVTVWRELLENPQVGKIGHNLKYDVEVLAQSGITLGPIIFDTMVASYLLNPGSRQHSLDLLAEQELGHSCIPITDLIGTGKQQLAMSDVTLEQMTPYACEDAMVAWQLYEVFKKQMAEQGLTRVFEELEMPLIPILAEMELAGVKIDTKELEKLRKIVSDRRNSLQEKIWRSAGREFNVNSTQQLRAVLYEELRLPIVGIARTQSGFSTAAAELDKLKGKHPIIAWLEDYREVSKLLNTYIETLPELADKRTGRIYAKFNQTVAATGRLSSSDPNLQNIPVRTDLGKEIRAAFVAEPGKRLVKADYSQLELRVAAHIARDEKMMDAFRAGEDIHRATAAWVHGVEISQVTEEQRRQAKTLNFGVLYGMGAQKFARSADVSVEEARSFIERYKEQYEGITRWIDATVKQARELGFVETLLGRRRYIPEINSRAPMVRSGAERAAFNFPVQGTAADILKKAMIDLAAVLRRDFMEARMVLTVHDELVCEVPEEQAEKIARVMKEAMEGAVKLDVPVLVDVAVGKNWRDVKGVEGGLEE
jgi:DNA polymerase-1